MFNKIVYQFSSTAAKNGINNLADSDVLKNIKELDSFLDKASDSWKRYAELNGVPDLDFAMCSGYRCPELNKLLGGTDDSPHTLGYAADITIKAKGYFEDFCKWAADYAKECASKNNPYDQIIIEGSGNVKWIHFSLYDYYGNQQMKSVVIPDGDFSKIYSITYGNPVMKKQSETLTTDPMVIKHQLITPTSNYEIEGVKGKNEMDLSVMPGTYMRCIYLFRRIMVSLGLDKKQAAGIVGNILADTDGKISTTKNTNGQSGICLWDYQKQIEFRKIFLNEEFLHTSNLMNQTSFLCKDIVRQNILEKLQKVKSTNDSCYVFYKNYKKRGIKLDSTSPKTKQELSLRRGYSTAALEIYDAYNEMYEDEWLVGYYQGNGLTDGPAIQKTNDKKLWVTSINDWETYYNSKEIEYLSEDDLDVSSKSDEFFIE